MNTLPGLVKKKSLEKASSIMPGKKLKTFDLGRRNTRYSIMLTTAFVLFVTIASYTLSKKTCPCCPTDSDGYYYAFRQTKVYKIGSTGIESETGIRSVFPNAPLAPGAAVYDRHQGKTYIFKGEF